MKSKNLITFILIFALLFSNTTAIYAENITIDSIGSINENDNGTTIGVDKTQGKETIYSDEILGEDTQNTLVYVSQASSFGVFIPKTIVLSGQDKNANYLVRVRGNIGGLETISVEPDKSFSLSQYGKNDIVANVSQDKTQWSHNEFSTLGNGSIVANDMTAGSWNGFFTFFINLNPNKKEILIAKNKEGIDLEATATYITGIQKQELLNELIENGSIENKNEIDLLINVESNEFEEYANTTIDVSNIAEEGDIIAIYHYDETNENWEFIDACIVNANGEITTNFSSFSPIALNKISENDEHSHNYNEWTITLNATCETTGLKERICLICKNVETETIKELGHSFNTKEINEIYLASASTCENTATYFYKCDRCDAKGTETFVNGSANGHQYGDWVTIKGATCTTKGSEKQVCSVCDKVVTREIDALGHDFSTTYTIDKEATCTEVGSQSQHCSRCSATQNVTEIPAKGHTSVNGGTSTIHTKCSVCNTTLSATHSYTKATTIEPTCTTKGTSLYTCDCGYSYTKQDINELKHNFATTYTIDKEATCTTKGSKSQHCNRCSATQNVTEIPAKGHTSVNGGTSDIHTKCSVCGTTLSTTHSYTKTTTIQPTCTTKGTSLYTCSCGYSYTKQDIEMLEHTYENVYHKHDGSTSKGGACYTANGHTHNSSCSKKTETTTCGGTSYSFGDGGLGDGGSRAICNSCGALYTVGTQPSSCYKKVTKTIYTCGNPTNKWKLSCKKTTSTIEYKLCSVCGYKE